MRRRRFEQLRKLAVIVTIISVASVCLAAEPTKTEQADARAAPAPPAEVQTSPLPNAEPPHRRLLPVSPVPLDARPPSQLTYFQYGIAFTAEGTVAAGPMCSGDASSTCIFGSGGGIAARLGQRWGDAWYAGGAYEMSKHDSGTLYRLGILQQLRAEVRRYLPTEHDTQWFVCGSLGAVAYGNEWALSEGGVSASVGFGVESQIMNGPLVGMMIGYRPIFFGRFTDSSALSHAPGFAHVVGIDLTLEGRERRSP